MKLRDRVIVSFAVVLFAGCTAAARTNNGQKTPVRTRTNIGFDWRFSRGDIEGADRVGFDASDWRIVDLPHDWSIEGPFAEDNPTEQQGGYVPAGVGWYRKTLDIPSELEGKAITIEFDGIYRNSDVWVNGKHLGNRPNGYISFSYDLTPHLEYGGENTIAVRVDNSQQPNSRWYSGSGIYRHVWLSVTNKIHVAHWGTYVTTPEVTRRSASVRVRTEVVNETSQRKQVEIVTRIMGPGGEMLEAVSAHCLTDASTTHEFDQEALVANPKLWSIDDPKLYRVETIVKTGGAIVDSYTTPFGIRTIRFDANEGFFLNERNVKLQGVCIHHDAGCVGAAVPDQVIERRLKILKAMGCNAIRTGHTPFSPVFYDLCDRMGILVLNEAFDCWMSAKSKSPYGYNLYFEKWWARDLTDQIHRDRNHPSVIMWGIGNEVHETKGPEGLDILIPIRDLIHAEDPTRLVTVGCNGIKGVNAAGVAEAMDVVGYNGGSGSCFEYDNDHKTYPERKMYGSEVPHSFQTRGVYRTQTTFRDASKMKRIVVPDLTAEEVFTDFHPSYNSSYDNSYVRICARESWRMTKERDFFAGEFRWTGFDYLGESRGWPAKHFNAGVIDTCGFAKENYYFYQSQWTDEPMVHILPHWTWKGKEGTVIPVWAYTNCDTVELYLNGKSLGEKTLGDKMNLSWDVEYTRGTLKAVGKRGGKVVSQDIVHTAGKPARAAVSSDRKNIRADGRDLFHLEVRIVDDKGRFVPTAVNEVTFDITGPGRIIGVDNGDSIDHASYQTNSRKAFAGMCLAIIQSTQEPGQIRVTAKSKGLRSSTVTVNAQVIAYH